MVMKRLLAPGFWPVERKTKKYVVEPRPGPHSKYASLPLGVVIRDVLKYAFTASESRRILNAGNVLVDRRVRKDTGFPVGLMDVVAVGEDNYRVLAGKRGLNLVNIDKHDAGIKLLRVEGKTCVNKTRTQVHFHDGTNMLIDAAHGKRYGTGDVAVYDIAGRTVKDVVRLEKGSAVMIIRGNNMGVLGTVVDLIVTKSPMPNQAAVDIGGRTITLPRSYVFVVGKNEPVIKMQAHNETRARHQSK
jgi:small subunit ribosomal protein S4e